jgi:hypothetical protein
VGVKEAGSSSLWTLCFGARCHGDEGEMMRDAQSAGRPRHKYVTGVKG